MKGPYGITSPTEYFRLFFKQESAGGLLLMGAAAIALIISNSPLSVYYDFLLSTPVHISVGTFGIDKPLLLWINDGLMASFFFLVGMELKRELVEGDLADPRKIILPGIGAIGGMAIPVLIFLLFNMKDPVSRQGWAIPAATDIAFALGILSLLGKRVPSSVKVFLTSLAIFDDIGAVLIIAFFFTSKISLTALGIAAACILILAFMNHRNVTSKSLYIFIGSIMWVATLKSGVHATLAGVVLAMFIPMRSLEDPTYSPLKRLEKDLHKTVALIVLPIFAFANAGIDMRGMDAAQFLHKVPLGITAGLFIGKQLGIFTLCWLFIKLGLAKLPEGMNMKSLYGTAILCGVGFTMSLFIGSLAFQETGVDQVFDERLGIIMGSVLSGIAGYVVLKFSLREKEKLGQ